MTPDLVMTNVAEGVAARVLSTWVTGVATALYRRAVGKVSGGAELEEYSNMAWWALR